MFIYGVIEVSYYSFFVRLFVIELNKVFGCMVLFDYIWRKCDVL